MTMLSSLDLIRRVPLFSMLTESQAVSVADAVVKRRFKRGEVIVEDAIKLCPVHLLSPAGFTPFAPSGISYQLL